MTEEPASTGARMPEPVVRRSDEKPPPVSQAELTAAAEQAEMSQSGRDLAAYLRLRRKCVQVSGFEGVRG